MNREILKFRAWDGLNKKFTYWTLNDLCTWDTKDEKPSALDEWEQYIGRKDKNGVDIYEGDLAPCIYHFTGCKGILEVIYSEHRASFMVKHHGECQQKKVEKLIYDFARQTIIGNIHQNPELLNS